LNHHTMRNVISSTICPSTAVSNVSVRMPAKRNLQQNVLKGGSCFCSRTLIRHEEAKPGMRMGQATSATMQAMLGRRNQKRKCVLGTKPEIEKDRAQSRQNNTNNLRICFTQATFAQQKEGSCLHSINSSLHRATYARFH
jgi:hypothetical protein